MSDRPEIGNPPLGAKPSRSDRGLYLLAAFGLGLSAVACIVALAAVGLLIVVVQRQPAAAVAPAEPAASVPIGEITETAEGAVASPAATAAEPEAIAPVPTATAAIPVPQSQQPAASPSGADIGEPPRDPPTIRAVFVSRGNYGLLDKLKLATGMSVEWLDSPEVREAAGRFHDGDLDQPEPATARMKLARSLDADLLVIVKQAMPSPGPSSLELVFCEGEFGAVVANRFFSSSSAEVQRSLPEIAALVACAIAVVKNRQPVFCTVVPFREGSPHTAPHDWLPAATTALVREQVYSSGRIAYVEPEAAILIDRELSASSRPDACQISGEVFSTGDWRSPSLDITIRLKRGVQQLGSRNKKLNTLEDVPPFVLEATTALLETAAPGGPATLPSDNQMLARSLSLRGYLRRTQLVACLEAAVLLDPESIERRVSAMRAESIHMSSISADQRGLYLRFIEHLDKFFVLGGTHGMPITDEYKLAAARAKKNGLPAPDAVNDPTQRGSGRNWRIDSEIGDMALRSLPASNSQIRRAAGWNDATDTPRFQANLRQIIQRRVATGLDATFYFEWLIRGQSTEESLQTFALAVHDIQENPLAGMHAVLWFDRIKIDMRTEGGLVRRCIARLEQPPGGPLQYAVTQLRARFPRLPAQDVVRRLQSNQYSLVNNDQWVVGNQMLEFGQWKRKDGRAAELAPLGVEGNVVEFATRSKQLRELLLSELADEDRARLEAWKAANGD